MTVNVQTPESSGWSTTIVGPRWLTVEEAAEYARVSPSLIRKWITEKDLVAAKTGKDGGGRAIIDRLDIDKLLESRKQ